MFIFFFFFCGNKFYLNKYKYLALQITSLFIFPLKVLAEAGVGLVKESFSY